MEVAPDVFLIPGCIGNLYLILETDTVTLIDTGLKGCSQRILRELRKLNRSPGSIQRIIITHADGDHYGSLHDLQAITKAKTYASDIEARAIQNGQASRSMRGSGIFAIVFKLTSRLFKAKPARVDTILKPGDELDVLGGMTVLETPGHTPGHISLYSPSTGILFSGDSMIIKAEKLIPSKGANTWNGEAAFQSYQMQVALNPKFILGGHGWRAMNGRLWRDIGQSD